MGVFGRCKGFLDNTKQLLRSVLIILPLRIVYSISIYETLSLPSIERAKAWPIRTNGKALRPLPSAHPLIVSWLSKNPTMWWISMGSISQSSRTRKAATTRKIYS